jgi:hypothetical protein
MSQSIHAGHLTVWFETTFLQDEHARTTAHEVHQSYHRWCRAQGEQPCRAAQVVAWLKEQRYRYQTGPGGAAWVGLELRATAQQRQQRRFAAHDTLMHLIGPDE